MEARQANGSASRSSAAGAGTLAAAFELTATPELRETYDLTVYQLGWRCGGKGASGRRDINGALRIEEHGLHVWFGFYENAFDVMRRVYEELDRPEGAALRTWQDAFHPTNEVVLCDDTEDDRWIPRQLPLPAQRRAPRPARRPAVPARPDARRDPHAAPVEPPGPRQAPPQGPRQVLRRVPARRSRSSSASEGRRRVRDDQALRGLPEVRPARSSTSGRRRRSGSPDEPLICRFLRVLTDVIWAITGGDRYAMTFDVTSTVFRGILSDDLDDRAKGGFAQVNDEEFMAWMARHGARPETLDRVPDPARLLPAVLRLQGRRPRPAVHRRRQGAAGDAAHVPRLQGRDHVEDAGRHGRRDLRAHVRGAPRARRALRVLPRRHEHRDQRRRHARRRDHRPPPGAHRRAAPSTSR